MPTDRQHFDSEDGASILPFPTMSPAERPDDDSALTGDDDLRSVLGSVLRTERRNQDRTLADVAGDAHVSLAYLSEVERGLKDVSSDLLGAIIDSLDVPLATVLGRCIERLPVTGTQRGLDARLLAA